MNRQKLSLVSFSSAGRKHYTTVDYAKEISQQGEIPTRWLASDFSGLIALSTAELYTPAHGATWPHLHEHFILRVTKALEGDEKRGAEPLRVRFTIDDSVSVISWMSFVRSLRLDKRASMILCGLPDALGVGSDDGWFATRAIPRANWLAVEIWDDVQQEWVPYEI